jgi:hypothetical protein
MIYELFLEGELADIRQDLGMQLSFNIDDINKYGSRDTSFSKTIVLPGTAKNNRLLGFVGELGSYNNYTPGAANIGSNFNPAQTTRAELRANGLLLLKGVFRLTGIVKDRDLIEYEGSLFGELGGFIASIGKDKLEDLDFSEYNHNYTRDNIVGSWDSFSKFTELVTFTANSVKVHIPTGTGWEFTNNTIFYISNTDINKGSYYINSISVQFNVFVNGIEYDIWTYNVSQTLTINSTLTPVDLTGYIAGDSAYGVGYYYPLIDHGRYSSDKINYDYRTFRPALFVKEYIDKIFAPSGYTYDSNFLDSNFFKKLIIPCNFSKLTKKTSDLLSAKRTVRSTLPFSNGDFNNPGNYVTLNLPFPTTIFANAVTDDGNPNFTYIGSETVNVNIDFKFKARVCPDLTVYSGDPNSFLRFSYHSFRIRVYRNSDVLFERINVINYTEGIGALNLAYNWNIDSIISTQLNPSDTFKVELYYIGVQQTIPFTTTAASYVDNASITVIATNPITTDLLLNDPINLNQIIPQNILQVDFFTWLVKMFNLYITEDKIRPNNLLIEPYKDYYDFNNSIDWTYKVARDKPWQIKPMGMMNGRFFEYKFKSDNDYYNENFRKKFSLSYGDILEDTRFQFAKQKQTLEIGFSPSVLVEYQGAKKVTPAIYKLTKGNSVEQEEWFESNIRIMMVKKMSVDQSWSILNKGVDLKLNTTIGAALTKYGYAGHFDDPKNPTVDINFGAAAEIYFDPLVYPSANLFNEYWSGYIGEIADKDSKLLTCQVYLTELDIAKLDFSKPVFIDGVLWRINKIVDFDASSGELTKVELLKVINNG